MDASGFSLWHVTPSWLPPLKVRPNSGAAAERGPGVVACTNAQSARQLFKKDTATVRLELCATTRWLTGHSRQSVSQEAARCAVTDIFEDKARDAILSGLSRQPDPVRIWTVVALAIVARACAGNPGVALAQWLAAQRVDALVRSVSPSENWILIVQPACVRSALRISSVSASLPSFPPIDQQLAQVLQSRPAVSSLMPLR